MQEPTVLRARGDYGDQIVISVGYGGRSAIAIPAAQLALLIDKLNEALALGGLDSLTCSACGGAMMNVRPMRLHETVPALLHERIMTCAMHIARCQRCGHEEDLCYQVDTSAGDGKPSEPIDAIV